MRSIITAINDFANQAIIQSRSNPHFKELSLKALKQANLCLIEGERLVLELLNSRLASQLVCLVLSADYPKEKLAKLKEVLVKNAADLGEIELLRFSPNLHAQLVNTVTSQGIAACIKISDLKPQAKLLQVNKQRVNLKFVPSCAYNLKPIVLVLDQVQDPGNLGSIIRTACALGIQEIFSLNGTVHAWQPKVLRAAMGAMFKVTVYEHLEAATLLDQLKVAGYSLLAADLTGANLFEYVNSQAYLECEAVALVVGNEGKGLSAATRSAIKQFLTIPMLTETESLNVAAATAICLSNLRLQTNFKNL